MNQHASRPVAQGFPLHRRMNGSIQSNGPSRATQLRPSVMTNGGPLRRSLGFNSQIPIRIGFGNQSTSSSQQASLRARVLERHRQSLVNSTSPAAVAVAAVAAHQAMRTSGSASSASQQQQQPNDDAFKVYEDRLQTDFRDFRAMCSRLILKEKEEKEKWHNLCLKMMKERDTARQRISALINERDTTHSSSVADTSKASKRGRDESTSSNTEEQLPSRSSSVESRPIRGLRLSPVPSPPRSLSAASLNNSSTASSLPSASSESPPPPSSSNSNVVPTSTTSSPPPPSSDSSSSSSSSSSAPPLNIMTFNPARSPSDKTCFDVFGEFDIPESRPVKRRKSHDVASSDDEPLPFLIAHTDIMYMPMKGRLYCRACLLDKTTNPSSFKKKNRNPKTFPTNVDWNELKDHCVEEHFTACQDVARLSPADLNELRRHLYQ